jgi:hypothetical protein
MAKRSWSLVFMGYQLALIVQVRVAEYDPVLYFGSSDSENVTFTEFGSVELHSPPPPVQAEDPIEITLVAEAVLTTCVPEHETPRVAPPHV